VDIHRVSPRPHADDLRAVTTTFRALAEPTRARLVLALLGGECPVGDLVALLEAPQSTVSRHLAVLRAAGLVASRREANRVHYRLANAHVRDLVVQAFSHAEHERLALPDHPGRDEARGDARAPGEEASAVAAQPIVAESRH
jgi:DNA-binding transcriptional ArsR family regulator